VAAAQPAAPAARCRSFTCFTARKRSGRYRRSEICRAACGFQRCRVAHAAEGVLVTPPRRGYSICATASKKDAKKAEIHAASVRREGAGVTQGDSGGGGGRGSHTRFMPGERDITGMFARRQAERDAPAVPPSAIAAPSRPSLHAHRQSRPPAQSLKVYSSSKSGTGRRNAYAWWLSQHAAP